MRTGKLFPRTFSGPQQHLELVPSANDGPPGFRERGTPESTLEGQPGVFLARVGQVPAGLKPGGVVSGPVEPPSCAVAGTEHSPGHLLSPDMPMPLAACHSGPEGRLAVCSLPDTLLGAGVWRGDCVLAEINAVTAKVSAVRATGQQGERVECRVGEQWGHFLLGEREDWDIYVWVAI